MGSSPTRRLGRSGLTTVQGTTWENKARANGRRKAGKFGPEATDLAPDGRMAGTRGEAAGYEQTAYATERPKGPSFPAYDHARPGQHITVIQESRSTTSLEGVGLVQAVQSAVNQARKSESRLVRLQKEKARKEQMWAQYAKDMQSAFTKERARHAADVQKLQQDILDTQAQITEDQQQVQVAAAGCFRGMAGSSEAQKEWDALVSEGQAELGDTPMSNSDLYAMLVRCVQTASGAAVPNILQTTNAAQASAHVPARVGPLTSSGGGTTGQPGSVEADAAPGYMSASPGPALRDPYMRSPGLDTIPAGPELGLPSPSVRRNPTPTGLRPRTSVKQVVNGVAKTISPGRQLAAKLDQKRRALIPFGGAGAPPNENHAAGSADHITPESRAAPTLPEAYDIDLDSDPDMAKGDLEGLG